MAGARICLNALAQNRRGCTELTLALEIERRFLVSGLDWRRHSLWQARLRQGYLSHPGEGLTVRVRSSEPLQGQNSSQAWLTLKAPPPAQSPPAGPVEGRAAVSAPTVLAGTANALAADSGAGRPGVGQALSRLEFEYAIPPADAEALLALTDQQLVKIRHGLDLEGGDWVLDVFEGANAPLVVAEVELEHPDQAVELPPWCVRELTDRRELSNAALAARPLAQWSEPERRELLAGL